MDLDSAVARLPAPLRPVADLGQRCFARFVELEGIDRSMALAGQAFAALLPLLIVVGSLSPNDGRDAADTLIEEFRLSGSAATALKSAMAQPAEVQDSVSVLGFLLLAISALSFTRALQRLYVRAWRLSALGVRGNGWGLMWLAAFSVWVTVQPAITALFDGVVALAVTLALSTLLWLFTPWILTGKRIHWRRLLPQATLTAVGQAALAVVSAIYAPRAVASAAEEFGVIGVAFALLSLLFLFCFVLVTTAAIGATVAEAARSPAPGDVPRVGAHHDPADIPTTRSST